MDMREEFLNEKFREKFDVQFVLYNGVTLPQLIPSLDGKMIGDAEFLSLTKYLFISILNNEDKTAFVTLDIKSPNNPQLSVLNYKHSASPGERVYELLYLSAPAMKTRDEEAVFEYEIKDVLFK